MDILTINEKDIIFKQNNEYLSLGHISITRAYES